MNTRRRATLRLLLALVIAAALFFAARQFLAPRLNLEPFEDWLSRLPIETIEQKIITAPKPLESRDSIPEARLTRAGVITATNNERQKAGLQTLAENAQLNAAAELKANDMFNKQYFDHVSETGEGPDHWVEAAGYRYRVIGENLALGDFLDDAALVAAWMASPGHRENILNTEFTEIGVAVKKGTFEGRVTWIAVQEFGRPRPVCAEPKPELRAKIEQYQQALGAYEAHIEAKRQELDQDDHKRSPEYREKVEEYNLLVEQYNALVPEYKATVDSYNTQVSAYNACAGA